MKNVLFVFLILIAGKRNFEQTDQNFINNLATKYRDFYIYMAIPVVHKGVNVEVVITNTELYRFYNKKIDKSHFKNFKSFLTEVLSRKYIIPECKDLHLQSNSVIDEESPIIKLYKLKGFQAVINRYLTRGDNDLIEKKQVQGADNNALIEIMFSHKYYVSFSDHSGVFSFRLQPW